MKWFDRYLQNSRFKRAYRQVLSDDIVLDLGCHEGQFLQSIQNQIARGIGVDPDADLSIFRDPQTGNLEFVCGGVERIGHLPSNFRPTFITALAVIEHLSDTELEQFASNVASIASPNARLFVTAPSPLVDPILVIGKGLRILDGMDSDSHHGLHPKRAAEVISSYGWSLLSWTRFQFGLNNAILFCKCP